MTTYKEIKNNYEHIKNFKDMISPLHILAKSKFGRFKSKQKYLHQMLVELSPMITPENNNPIKRIFFCCDDKFLINIDLSVIKDHDIVVGKYAKKHDQYISSLNQKNLLTILQKIHNKFICEYYIYQFGSKKWKKVLLPISSVDESFNVNYICTGTLKNDYITLTIRYIIIMVNLNYEMYKSIRFEDINDNLTAKELQLLQKKNRARYAYIQSSTPGEH